MAPTSINVLILGGLTHLGRALLTYLVRRTREANDSSEDEPEIKHIRIVDKYLVAGHASTVFVDSDALRAIEDPRVEYRQANLTIHATASRLFDAPDGTTYDFVFDLTGEGVLVHDVPSELLLERTTKLAASLANEAAKRGVRAYIRETSAFWKVKTGGKPLRETDVEARGDPNTPRAYYYYEAERAVANVKSLPVAILRSANVYGPHQYYGTVTPKIALGEVYAYLKEPFKLLWSGDIRAHTIHVRDWCQAAWLAALWVGQRSRDEADAIAGVILPYLAPKSDRARIVVEVPDATKTLLCPESVAPLAPVFHIADNDDVTKGHVLATIGKVFNIDTGFTNAAINAWAKFNLGSVVDDSNEKHAEAMAALAEREGLTTRTSPLTCFLSEEDVAPRVMSYDSAKAQHILRWTPRETFNERSVKEVVQSFKDAGMWVCR